ncbi:hydroxymethylbilane synthase [Mangrovibacillus cuniculi]|uniref:Porphobilinogen deaminase n=1 Tax=Mangrovibacillus cuniculi TaxID=2593652 RepID=A0A7S8HG00_9BACI|nr:hydroxymethylbilane synthase [Mangrovibacillus cuniculi]QPC47076.1 hydroxymethylbilane synthase [Mangrovibacillus cuniculi]
MRKTIHVGSRRSKLALTQTNWVMDQLKKIDPSIDFTLTEIVTKGDRILDVTLSKVGGKGLFVKEIEQALLDKKIDIAIHSMKDMPAELPDGLTIGCIPVREDPRDALISKDHLTLENLPTGAVIGTSSLRRGAQLVHIRPDLEIKWIRGNIDTRLEKLQSGEYDAIILAAAGLSRMGWSQDVVTEYLEPIQCVPAVGQGALAIECRSDDTELLQLLEKFTNHETSLAVTAERAFLKDMDGGCQVPIAGYATVNGEQITLTALVGSPKGETILKEVVTGSDPVQIGKEAAKLISAQGGYDLIQQVKKELEKE